MDIDFQIAEVLNEVVKSINTNGYKKTLTELRKFNVKDKLFSEPNIQFIFNTIVQEFNTTPDILMYGKYVRGDIKYAVGFCVYYLYEDYTMGDIQKIVFKTKDKGILSKYRQLIEDLDIKHKHDLPLIKIKDSLDNKIKNYKQDNK